MQLMMYVISTCTGSSLSMCTFNGQQCCSEQTLGFFNSLIRPQIDNNTFDFDGAFDGARDAIIQLKNETQGTQIYIS